jgi:hypothetical protein
MNTVFIYYLHKGDNIPFYIGKTGDLNQRLREHKNKKGECFIEVLEEVNIDEWVEKEKLYIKKYLDLGYVLNNQNFGGGGSKIGTKKHSKDSKSKLSKSRKGKKLNQEIKDKIYTKLRNTKISESLKGRKFSKEHIKNLSRAKINKISNSTRPVLQFDLKENFIKEWPSITEAKFNLGRGDIQGCVLGKSKTAGGFIWRYKN